MKIRAYNKDEDEDQLMKMIETEGKEWACYSDESVSDKYKLALCNSITYVAYEGDRLCGYSRSINDCGFYVYVCDLLVMPKYRGRKIGRKLMECIYTEYPNHIVYVMSDVDEYYMEQGYKREGSIYEVTNSKKEQ
ncbi:N-acetyltransferase [Ancylomarina euxinus]|uniref:N-acetyltransferase n=1 Tax=Ancylomarina euxinus TaxID=2283627 RepID=A0A425XWJ1_9BACT|nr:GNAT family N-acetyltransferase [Ancylomarina euxinus]MCZ4696410.1 GNAT family N-acetyltransferase [Ancylomarina euxinus]RRG19011.1 N-acetyltransferase [Ancylomarina euxinus]